MTLRSLFVCVPILVLALTFFVPANADDGDKYYCPLNASSPFSWVVMIWDMNKGATHRNDGEDGTASMGSLITCNAVLTTAYYYNKILIDQALFIKLKRWNRLRVIGQYIYDRTSGRGRTHPCWQNMTVETVEFHHKTTIPGQRILFDFAIVVMDKPFNVISPTFPTMFFPSTALELLMAIRYVNIIQSETYCTIPTQENFNKRDWIFYDKLDVRSKPFHSQCIRVLCEQKQSGGRSVFRPNCERKLNEMLNATMLCMIPNWEQRLGFPSNPDGSLYPNPYAGLPLICNGTTLGMTNFVKTRAREGYPRYQQDFFFTITLLRVLPFLIERIKAHTPEIKPFYIEDQALTRVDIPEPSRLTTENWGFDLFYTLPSNDNPFPPPYVSPYSLAPATFCQSIFSITLTTSLLCHLTFSST